MLEKSRKNNIISLFFYLIAVIVIIFALLLIWPVHLKYRKMKANVDSRNEALEKKTAECVKLNKEVQELESEPKAVEKIAREKFNMCKEGEVILKYDSKK